MDMFPCFFCLYHIHISRILQSSGLLSLLAHEVSHFRNSLKSNIQVCNYNWNKPIEKIRLKLDKIFIYLQNSKEKIFFQHLKLLQCTFFKWNNVIEIETRNSSSDFGLTVVTISMNASLCNLLYVKSIDISTQNKIFKA